MGASWTAETFSKALRLSILVRFLTGVVKGTGASPDAECKDSAPEASPGSEDCTAMANCLYLDQRGAKEILWVDILGGPTQSLNW